MSARDGTSSILVIGGTKAGKTHYGGQLLRRLLKGAGTLKTLSPPSDLTPFQEVLERLAVGKSASHTPSGTYKESIWHLGSKDEALETNLVWPDYAGEQIEDIVKLRQVPELWVNRIRESDGWIFFVRLKTVRAPEDVLTRPRVKARMSTGEEAPLSEDLPPLEPSARVSVSTQAGLVELLQALLFVKQANFSVRLKKPALVVVLSCWDEANVKKSAEKWMPPAELLRDRLPLLSQFVNSTWQEDCVEVIGLSALGKALLDDKGDDQFMDEGPERQGWCVQNDGSQNADLSLPIASLMRRIVPNEE